MFPKQIGIDLGYGYVKVYDGSKEVVFPSTVGVGTDLRFNSLLMSFKKVTDNLVITVDNKRYFVGDLAVRQSPIVSRSMGRNRVEDINSKVLLLAGLALFVENGEQKFNVVNGLPVDYYQQYKDDWALLMQGTHAIKFGTGSSEKPMLITIDKLQLIPQPFGTLYDRRLDNEGNLLENELANLKVGIVDIGYKTSDFALASDLEFVGKQSASSDIAMSTAHNLITQRIQDKFKLEKESYEMDKIIESGLVRVNGVPQDISEFKREAFSTLADKVATEVNNLWDKREIDVILLTGGGGKAIAEYFLPKFPQAVLVNESQTANVRGYLKLANALFRMNFSNNERDD
ncbi:MAG: ParM/StbA family protein [Peptococcia bacterium]